MNSEHATAAHPDVAEVAVIGVPHQKWGETVKAVVGLRPGSETVAAELIAFTRERLTHSNCLTSVEFIDELPRTPAGKVVKNELRETCAQPLTPGAR